MKKTLMGFILLLGMSACHKQTIFENWANDPMLYCKSVKELNNVVLQNNFPPMIAIRNYAYANIAAYETLVAGDTNYLSLSGQIMHLPTMPKPMAGQHVHFMFASVLSLIKVGNAVTFPEGSLMDYYEDVIRQADSVGMPRDMIQDSKAFSDSVVSVILAWSKKDNYAQTRSSEKYTVLNVDGRWIPTPPMYAQAVEPHWREIRTLVIDSASQFMPSRPPAFNVKDTSSTYYQALLEVKRVGENLTAEQKHIADFWDDNPFKLNVSGHVMFATKRFSPPGHWMNIVGIAAKKANVNFATTVCAYTLTSIANFDAFISCWDEKYRSNYVRPETVINKYLDPGWRPYIQTPPFPSYTSGHATNSAAAAEAMTHILGDNLSFTDSSLLEFGIANRQIQSFRKAAHEASMSRLYGGIHYRFDNEQGAKYGKYLGELIVHRIRMRKH